MSIRGNRPPYNAIAPARQWRYPGEESMNVVWAEACYERGGRSIRPGEADLTQLRYYSFAKEQPYGIRRLGEMTICRGSRTKQRRVQPCATRCMHG